MNLSPRELDKLLRGNPDLQVDGNYTHRETPREAPVPHTTPRKRNEPEHDLQVAIIEECDERASDDPLWSLIFAIPNGGKRHRLVAAKLKAEGVRSGVPDLFWPIARHGYHGLFMELKISPNKPQEEQEAWIAALTKQSYCCRVVYDSFEDAIAILEWYRKGDV